MAATPTEFEFERAYDRDDLASVFRTIGTALENDRPLRIDDGGRVAEVTIPPRLVAAFELEHERDDEPPVTELELELEWEDPDGERLRFVASDDESAAGETVSTAEPTTDPATAAMPPDAVAGRSETGADGSDGATVAADSAAEPADGADRGDRTSRFEVYEDRAGEWRWRLVHWNGNVIADGGEGYASRSNARRAVRSVRRAAPAATIEDRAERSAGASDERGRTATAESRPDRRRNRRPGRDQATRTPATVSRVPERRCTPGGTR